MPRYPYRPIKSGFGKDFRNEQNQNLLDIESDIKGLQGEFDNVVERVSEKAFDKVVNSAKIEWLPPVNTFNDLASTYPNVIEGKTAMTRDSGKIYRFNGESWIEIQDIDPSAINEVDNRLSLQLADESKKVANEFALRGVNIMSLGAKSDGSDNYPILLSLFQKHPFAYVPRGDFYISSIEGIDERRLYGEGNVYTDGYTFAINSGSPATVINDYLKNKGNFHHRRTFGTFQNASVGGVVANNPNPKIQVFGIQTSKEASAYSNRDSAAWYTAAYSANPTVTHAGGTIEYTNTTVKVTGATVRDLDKVLPGMIIDTKHSPKMAAIISKIDVENQLITIKEGWYAIVPGGSDTPSIPANGTGFDINRVTKIWGRNNNVFLLAEHDTNLAVADEIGLFNYKPLTENVDIGGIDIVNFKKKARFGSRVRKANDAEEGFGVAFEARDSDNGFAFHASDENKISLISYLNGDANDKGFNIRADGEISKLKLTVGVFTDGMVQYGSPDIKIIILSKTKREDFSIHSPVDRTGELLIIQNAGSAYADIKTKDGSNLVYKGSSLPYLRMLPRTSMILVSDGNSWYALTGTVENLAPFDRRQGLGAPTTNADFIGQIYNDVSANAEAYISVSVGKGASDWKKITN